MTIRRTIISIIAVITLALGIVIVPTVAAHNDSVAEHAPVVAAVLDSQVEEAAANALVVCNDRRSDSTIGWSHTFGGYNGTIRRNKCKWNVDTIRIPIRCSATINGRWTTSSAVRAPTGRAVLVITYC